MVTIREVIDHGDFHAEREVTVRELDEQTWLTILRSSPYHYANVRELNHNDLVALTELEATGETRRVGWSTFTLVEEV